LLYPERPNVHHLSPFGISTWWTVFLSLFYFRTKGGAEIAPIKQRQPCPNRLTVARSSKHGETGKVLTCLFFPPKLASTRGFHTLEEVSGSRACMHASPVTQRGRSTSRTNDPGHKAQEGNKGCDETQSDVGSREP